MQQILIPGVGDLNWGVSSLWCLHDRNMMFRVSTTSCLLRPGGEGRGLQLDLNLVSAMRARGSNCGNDGGPRGAGTLAGTLNMSEN